MATLAFMQIHTKVDLKELIPGAIIGSCLPDMDTQKSWVAQAIPFIDDKLRDIGVFNHRGITHGMIKTKKMKKSNKKVNILNVYTGMIFLAFIFYVLLKKFNNDLMIGITVGYASHVILDLFAEFIGITCKSDNKMYNIGWIINTILIINYLIGLDVMYYFLINITKAV
jgi:membrane-bound metal-dependent hydrolase YbcI (DUF457 family)